MRDFSVTLVSASVSTTTSGTKSEGFSAIDSQQSMNPRASSSKIWAFQDRFNIT